MDAKAMPRTHLEAPSRTWRRAVLIYGVSFQNTHALPPVPGPVSCRSRRGNRYCDGLLATEAYTETCTRWDIKTSSDDGASGGDTGTGSAPRYRSGPETTRSDNDVDNDLDHDGRGCRWEVKTIKHIMCADQDMFLRCMDRVVALDTRSCDDTCRSNIQILKCTDTISPFCRTYLYPDDVTGYTCHPNQLPTTQGVAFTWLDQPNRQLATVTVIAPAPRTSSTPDSTSATSSADPTAKGGNSHNSNIPVIVGGLVGGLVVLILAAVAVFFIKKKYRAGKDTDSGAATEPTFDRFGLGAHGGAHNRDDENERSPLSRNPPMVSSHYARDSVSAISQQSDSRMSMQSSGTFVGYQGMGPGGQPETIQEMATDQQIHEMGTDYKGHEM
ncbi:hypothetical protein RB598_007529 [Gaeumannomyces tritici]